MCIEPQLVPYYKCLRRHIYLCFSNVQLSFGFPDVSEEDASDNYNTPPPSDEGESEISMNTDSDDPDYVLRNQSDVDMSSVASGDDGPEALALGQFHC